MRTLFLTLITCLFVLPAYAKYSGGTGEPNDPYQIATAEDLMLLGETPDDYDKDFILTADIDLDPNLPGRKVFDKAVIAPDTDPTDKWGLFRGTSFSGTFDGKGHTISHLTIKGARLLGLFGYLRSTASVSNLGLEAVEISGDGNVGGLVGSNNGGRIVASYSSGSVSGSSSVGGLVGSNGGSIATSYSSGSVSGNQYVGGLVGSNNGGRIVASYSSGSVSGSSYVGGLAGYNGGSIATSYSSGSVSGSSSVGGLVGINSVPFGGTGSINSSFWDIQTSGQTTSAGGIGKTTAQMQNIETFLSAGWDLANEVANGTCDYWQVAPGDYPRLQYQGGNRPLMPEGRGTAEQPYLIRDARELGTVWFEPLAHYRLAQSVDLSGITWSMAVIPSFGGSFDGSGYVIGNLHIQGDRYLGLFGYLRSTASVSNLGLEAVEISGDGNVGGLVGYNNGGRIVASYSSGSVSGSYYVGGLVGSNANEGGRIATSYSSGSVSGNQYVGGLVGINSAPFVGGTGSINSSFWDIQTSGQTTSAGGVGKSTAEMKDPKTFTAVGWDFVGQADGLHDIWAEPEEGGYPLLWWQIPARFGLPSFSGGTGEPDEPYLISRPEELNRIANNPRLMTCHFRLIEDLDLTGIRLYPIGDDWPYSFGGIFDGNRHTISHLAIRDDRGEGYLGLFSRLASGAEVKDLGVVDVNVPGWGSYVGGIVGWNDGDVTNCYSAGTVNGCSRLVGSNHGTVTQCRNTGTVSGGGGLVGSNSGTVTQCYNTGTVSGGGGLVGSNSGTVTQCFNSGTVSGGGGLVGSNHGTVTQCFNSGAVNGSGGLVGSNSGTVTQCYNTGAVSGVGGLVGGNNSSGYVSQCYSTGPVSGAKEVGGLVGFGLGIIHSNFWDIETSGQATSAGGTGKTTAEMQTAKTFTDAGWDFAGETANGTEDLWWIDEGKDYPRLWWQYGWARSPDPADGARDVSRLAILRWIHGGAEFYHDVYFADDRVTVANATSQTQGIYRGRQAAETTTYDPGILEWGKTYYWRIEEVNGADPNAPRRGSVWSFTTTDCVKRPYPAAGARDVAQAVVVTWVPGEPGLQYDVYLGEDTNDVAGATPQTPVTYRGRQPSELAAYDPGVLKSNTTYYWRVDGVDENDPWSPWKGKVWSFTTADYISVVDDFESYTDDVKAGQAIFHTWLDGSGWIKPEPNYPGNGTGSFVGNIFSPFAEQEIVHSGRQSMPMDYNDVNTPWYSEAERTWEIPQDWSIGEADTLTLYFRGKAGNGRDPLYVGIEDSAGRIAVVVHPDADAVLATEWQKWHIALADVRAGGVDIASVKKMYIGVGDRKNPKPGGTGRIYIDDIRLTKRMP